MIVRVVLDTNVYVSALQFGGKPRQVLDTVSNDGFQLLVSPPLRAELERVLVMKFGYSSTGATLLTESLWANAEWVSPNQRIRICPDEPDNRVLECAYEERAGFIVTGDRHLLSLPTLTFPLILTPGAFLQAIEAMR